MKKILVFAAALMLSAFAPAAADANGFAAARDIERQSDYKLDMKDASDALYTLYIFSPNRISVADWFWGEENDRVHRSNYQAAVAKKGASSAFVQKTALFGHRNLGYSRGTFNLSQTGCANKAYVVKSGANLPDLLIVAQQYGPGQAAYVRAFYIDGGNLRPLAWQDTDGGLSRDVAVQNAAILPAGDSLYRARGYRSKNASGGGAVWELDLAGRRLICRS